MSLNAYRINRLEIEYEDASSFSLWHNNELASYLGIDEHGINEVPISLIEDAVEEIELDEDVRESLKADIEFAKSKGQNYVSYIVF